MKLEIHRRELLKLTGTAIGGGVVSSAPLTAAAPNGPSPAIRHRLEGGILTVTPLLDNAVRVRFSPDDTPPPPSQFLVGTDASPRFGLRREGANTALSLARLKCRLDADTAELRFSDAAGREILRAPLGRMEPSPSDNGLGVAVEQGFIAPRSERLFGGGQFQDGFLNLKGLSRRLTQVNTQISLPFFVSSAGYGLLWHNYGLTELNPLPHSAALRKVADRGAQRNVSVTTGSGSRDEARQEAVFEGEFRTDASGRYAFLLDVGSSMAVRHSVEIDGKMLVDFANGWLPPTTGFFAELGPGLHHVKAVGIGRDTPRLHFGPVDERTVLRSPAAEALDYVVIAGKDGAETVATYRRLTGQAPMLPKWAFGYIHCRERFKSQEELLANAREFRRRRLPVDVIVQDWQYWGKHGWNAMEFDRDFYPDPAGMLRDLHAMDMRLMLSVWAKVDRASELGKRFAALGYYIPDTDWVDFFNPEAAAFYWANERDKLLKLGVDCFWQDATEPENDDLTGRVTSAGTGETVRNIFPLQVARAVYDGQRRDAPRQRVFTLTRSAAPGQQRYATAAWSGDIGNDWETLKRQITGGLNFAAAGMPYWTVDAGGFFRPGKSQYSDPAYHERLIRWLQFGTFLPLQRVHGYQSDTEFWHYGPEVERLARACLELRYRLLPYVYSEAAEITRDGSSLLRPLVMDFVHDQRALDERYSYMFGKAFHVAPVVAPGVQQWPVYLPESPGGWYDFWSGEHRAGGTVHQIAAPLDRIPLHARAGSIVPLARVAQSTAGSRNLDLELRIYAGADGRFTLYDDDGTSYDYERGSYSRIAFAWDDTRKRLSISAPRGSHDASTRVRNLHLVLKRQGSPDIERDIAYRGEGVVVGL
ncbi:MAG: DUF5110 domain-containing protein [Sphingomonas sp.]|uniref:glycoside hydrolase family 31 protein n=1 Tax=Sphingomonas sp. TaxID=28214 RepID=UPI001B07CBDA|nr:TIM-barrel domain-containing protein [Sphingomonas sp.]MBO9624396.1 DUF5110 domain-containing protein [Sphingomonas sp.]